MFLGKPGLGVIEIGDAFPDLHVIAGGAGGDEGGDDAGGERLGQFRLLHGDRLRAHHLADA